MAKLGKFMVLLMAIGCVMLSGCRKAQSQDALSSKTTTVHQVDATTTQATAASGSRTDLTTTTSSTTSTTDDDDDLIFEIETVDSTEWTDTTGIGTASTSRKTGVSRSSTTTTTKRTTQDGWTPDAGTRPN